MNASIRKVHQYSSDPATLAREVGELARDVYQRTRYTFTEVTWSGLVTLDGSWKIRVGRTKPVAITIIDAYDKTNRRGELGGGVQWQWVDGQAQIDDTWTPFAGATEYDVTFLVIHKVGT